MVQVALRRSSWIVLFIAVALIVGLIVFATTTSTKAHRRRVHNTAQQTTSTTNGMVGKSGVITSNSNNNTSEQEGDQDQDDKSVPSFGDGEEDEGEDDTSSSSSRFLFVGNSYIYSNDLPTIFASVMKNGMAADSNAASNNDYEVYTDSVTPGGWRLGQHWDDFQSGTSELSTLLAPLRATTTESWNWVILQDQSQVPGFYEWDSYPGGDYDLSLQGAIGLNNAIGETGGGQTMFFMTWGRRFGDDSNDDLFPDFLTMQQKLTEGYKRYQNATSTQQRPTYMAPVGLVFQTIYNDLMIQNEVDPTEDGTLFSSLYSPDGSHPSILGSYVTALTLYSSMTGLDPTTTTIRDDHLPDSIPDETARLVQDAVKRTLLETAATGFITYPWGDVLRGGESS
jgi:hypothetical protein